MSQAIARHVIYAITAETFSRRLRITIARRSDVATLATIEARKGAMFTRIFGGLGGRATKFSAAVNLEYGGGLRELAG